MGRNHLDLDRLMEMRVKEVMTKNPPLCKPKTHILKLLKKLSTQKEDYVLVVDKSKRLQGIVTESDVLCALKRPSGNMLVGGWPAKEMGKIGASKVENLMSKHPLTINLEMKVRDALDMMMTHKFRHLPVFEKNKLVGALTIRNIINALK